VDYALIIVIDTALETVTILLLDYVLVIVIDTALEKVTIL
jgi:hypothetical protein